ncbi:enoyl-CoA hydratase/isomerase family protein [Rhizobium leguminosarum]|uniref:enoyl-CoA hydratase/isomerase family protein n=1 Tax=Rhizobium leguminosarum TaxID=384 RepID=UPI0024A801F2|nr:enoyl-CoA hydratase/isomerase family protein [Rhizobium leguminosarum]MDI5930006.1 enoyl-CoA hydratase/isomerase family protein [Rhizobium leguminosarum]
MQYEDFQHLTFDRPSPFVLRVTINRPERLNAVNARLHDELAEIWQTIGKDPSVHVAVITGAGRAFSVGGDLKEGQDNVGKIEPTIHTGEQALRLVYNMIHMDKPIISAINGPAAGAGLATALCADISIIAEDAFVTDAHTRIGVASGDHAVMLWPMFCGMPKAKLYLLTADRINGVEAERIGLVSKCVPAEDLMKEALDLAERLAGVPQQAIRWTKRCLNHWLRQASPILDLSVAYEGLNLMQDDAKEALASFLEKRPPNFKSHQNSEV